MHIDTGHNFPETISFRNNLVEKLGVKLIVGSVQEYIDSGKVKEETGHNASRNSLQIVSLLDTIEENKVDAAMGGARRDEEKARAKERFFSHRDEFGQWDPKNQRPELAGTYLMEEKISENILGFFQFLIGLKWMYGNISNLKILNCLVFIFLMIGIV